MFYVRHSSLQSSVKVGVAADIPLSCFVYCTLFSMSTQLLLLAGPLCTVLFDPPRSCLTELLSVFRVGFVTACL